MKVGLLMKNIVFIIIGFVLLAGCNADKNGEIDAQPTANSEVALETTPSEASISESIDQTEVEVKDEPVKVDEAKEEFIVTFVPNPEGLSALATKKTCMWALRLI